MPYPNLDSVRLSVAQPSPNIESLAKWTVKSWRTKRTKSHNCLGRKVSHRIWLLNSIPIAVGNAH